MDRFRPERREVLVAAASVAVGVFGLSGCTKKASAGEVTANEDLMREHGIIRRALLIYGEAARLANKTPSRIPMAGVADTAELFRTFIEDYHERALEEQHIFPEVRKLSGSVARIPDVLQAQHQRGREITDYVRRVAGRDALPTAEAPRFAATLNSLISMYEPHAALEDTVLFPAWKAALGERGYDEMGDEFEQLEKKMFGHDYFDDARDRIARVEQELGLADLAAFTAPKPALG